MKRDIIGIDVTVQYSDRTEATGHLSPIGTHANVNADPRLKPALEAMRSAIEGWFKPYGSKP